MARSRCHRRNTGWGQDCRFVGRGRRRYCRRSYTPPTETEKLVKAAGRRFLSIDANLMSIEPFARELSSNRQSLWPSRHSVNNAGIIRRSAPSISRKRLGRRDERQHQSLFFMCQAAGRRHGQQGSGKIINICFDAVVFRRHPRAV